MGFTEIFLIAVVAIVALGPEKLPGVMVDIAKMFKKLKGQVNEAKNAVESELKLSELQQEALSYKESLTKDADAFKSTTINDFTKDISEISKSVDADEIARETVKFPKKRYEERAAEEKKEDTKDV